MCTSFSKVSWCSFPIIMKISLCLSKLQLAKVGAIADFWDTAHHHHYHPPLCCVRYRGQWNSAWAVLCHLWCKELSSCTVPVLPRWSHTACPVRRQMFHTHWRHLRCATRVRSWTDTLHHLHRWFGADRRGTWAFAAPVCWR